MQQKRQPRPREDAGSGPGGGAVHYAPGSS
jgi:hypothetical protein